MGIKVACFRSEAVVVSLQLSAAQAAYELPRSNYCLAAHLTFAHLTSASRSLAALGNSDSTWTNPNPAASEPCGFPLGHTAQNQPIDVTFNNTGLNQRPRDELFVCLWRECTSKCKRIYDLKRHYTAVYNHTGGVGYFCPVDGCNSSRSPADHWRLWYCSSKYGADPLKRTIEGRILAKRGFARKDKWLRHLKREHTNKVDGDNKVLLEECEPRGQILLELRIFVGVYFIGRVQNDDGTWGNWYGDDYNGAAVKGFKTLDGTPFDPESTIGPDLSDLLDAQRNRNSSLGQLVRPLSSPSTSEGQSTSADSKSGPPTTSVIDPSTLSVAQIWRNYEAYTGYSSFNLYEDTGTEQDFSNGYF